MPDSTLPLSSLSLPIQGMTCAACAGRVQRALQKLPGVVSAQVNLASERAEVSGTATPTQLAAAVTAAGYQVAELSFTLGIGGMSCASCVTRVERALLAVPGVLEASASLASETAQLRALANVSEAMLAEALARAGYTLRAADAAADPAAQREARLEAWRLGAAALLATPFLYGMLGMALGRDWMPAPWLQFTLASVVQFWLGARFYRAGWAALRARTGNMDLLVALGTSAAWGLSTWQWLGAAHAHGMAPHLYFESAVVIIAFIRLGKFLEARARQATGAAIAALLALAPHTARRLNPAGQEETIPTSALRVDDVLVVRPGEAMPADALVLEGQSGVDESALTGESRTVEKAPGETVRSGTIALDGRLLIRATAVGGQTMLAQVAALVAAAQASRAPVQKLVDRISAIFVPTIIALALLTLAGWLLHGAAAEQAVMNAVAVLVIACPCALGLATPAAIMAGTGAAARAGILVRDADAIERAQGITLVAFDKTGTLTEGRPRLAGLHLAAGTTRDVALGLAAALQSGSEHPLARAVLAAAAPAGPATHFRALPGRGVAGTVLGRALILGSPRALAEAGASPGPLAAAAATESAQGRTLAWLLEGTQPLALLAFEDTPRPSAAAAIAGLKALGLKVAMLSGDSRAAAGATAAQLGLTDVTAEVLPADKAARVQAWQAAGESVAMVGDGVNDAAALAAADLGIAMGSGTDVAIKAAAITLLRGDPALVPAAIQVTRRTLRTIRQNLGWAFGYNAIGVPLAAFGLLSPALAGAAMALSSVSVLGNALLLAGWKVKP